MFETNSSLCKWHKCELELKAHHTPIEWKQHAEYAKVDIAKPTGVLPLGVDNNGNIFTQTQTATPINTPIIPCKQSALRGFAVGYLISIWTVIGLAALFYFVFR